MEQNTNTTTNQTGSARSEFVRPQEGRMLAGVSQGLANRFELPVWLVRGLFLVLTFVGGLGLALYVAGWVLMRSEDEPESPAERFFGDASSSRSWIGIGLIFIAALILLDNFTFLSGGVVWAVGLLVVGVLLYTGHIPVRGSSGDDTKEGVQQVIPTETPTPETESASVSGDSPAGSGPPPTPAPTPPDLPPSAPKPRESSILGRLTIGLMLIGLGVLAVLDNVEGVPIDAHPRHYLALAVTILGLGLIVGGFAGRARWLIIVGAIMVPTLLFSPIFEYEWDSETFDAQHTPLDFTELNSSYAIDVGNLEIDLRSLPWDGQTITLDADVDLGQLQIWIPRDVGIVGHADVDIGSVSSPGRTSSGLGDPGINFNNEGENGTVMLDAHVDVGNIEIRR